MTPPRRQAALSFDRMERAWERSLPPRRRWMSLARWGWATWPTVGIRQELGWSPTLGNAKSWRRATVDHDSAVTRRLFAALTVHAWAIASKTAFRREFAAGDADLLFRNG